MFNIAQEKRKYHKRLIQELLRKHKASIINEAHSPTIIGKREPEVGVNIARYKSLVSQIIQS